MAASEASDVASVERCVHHESERLGFALDHEARRRLASYFALLERWGQRIRLSGSREAGELICRHLADALYLDRALSTLEAERRSTRPQDDSHDETTANRDAPVRDVPVRDAPVRDDPDGDDPDPHYLDVGSGGGLPALPLLALRPERRLALVEARSRKATFLRSALYELGFSRAVVFDQRLEQLEASREFERRFAAAWALATFAPDEWLRRAAPLVTPNTGHVFVFVAGDDGRPPAHHDLEPVGEQGWRLADGRRRQLLTFRRRSCDPRST